MVASVNPDYFETVFSDVDLGPGGAVTLLGDDNTLRARVSGGQATGMGQVLKLASDHPLLDVNKPEGTYTRVSEVDNMGKNHRVSARARIPAQHAGFQHDRGRAGGMARHAQRHSGGGPVVGVAIVASGVGFLRGVRRLEESHAALAVSEAQAQSASQAKSEFMAAVSHELRTPLTSIRGFAELMELRLKEPSFREAATLIRQAADHLNTLLTEIPPCQSRGGRHAHRARAPHPVRELVQNTADFFAISAAQKGLALAVSVPDETPEMLICDGLRLKQILNNLLSNAQFTEQSPAGSGAPGRKTALSRDRHQAPESRNICTS